MNKNKSGNKSGTKKNLNINQSKSVEFKRLADLFKFHGIHPDKNLGQNFLCNPNVIRAILDAAGATKQDYVIEIGCGAGALTEGLCIEAGFVCGVEIDDRILTLLENRLSIYPNHKIVNQDILKTDIVGTLMSPEFLADAGYEEQPACTKIVGNLPYYITTPIMTELLKLHGKVTDITVMMQTEVAEKIIAAPGTDGYGPISVMAKCFTETERVTEVDGSSFLPEAPVSSTVLKFVMREVPLVPKEETEYMLKVTKAAFAQRRKTLQNCMISAGFCGGNKKELEEAIIRAGLEPNVRGEKLSLEQFAELARQLR